MNHVSDLTFRAANVDDIEAIVALVQSAYRGDVSRQGWTTEADILDGQRIDPALLRKDIERADSRVLLAERDGELVACCHVEKRPDAGYFGMFAVRPGLQGSGLGRRVLAQAEHVLADELGVSQVRMTVIDVREELIAWYERRGYVRTGQFAPFPYGDERFGIPRRDDLRFTWLSKSLAGTPDEAVA
ncbi:GNAT family N-acetyltransferase [Oleiagrimonas sp. C23AA]|uniref:GNAT family N-acetyltransferase n=1 Tax=Oleiagrimonas sp. C23AA TaxID=2719047 RepID=UPI00141E9C75|nr:GNAT family N-acetyltransferase [Oleiagrimonas sp. C23AA]NII10056.1 GNAT family N-acetyltransferase [Oleiagrimonas sp. C23AA]